VRCQVGNWTDTISAEGMASSLSNYYCAAVQELLRIERGSNPLSAEVDVEMGDDTASLQLTNLEEGDQEGQEEQVETWVSTRDSITLMTPAEESPCILCSSTGECDC
jgi:hypothetical protein